LVEKTDEVALEGYHRQRSGALRLSPDFSSVDTLMFFGDVEQYTVDAPWGPAAVAPPLAKRTEIAHRAGSSRICIGDQEAPEIFCSGLDGERILIRWTVQPAPILGSEIAQWREATIQEYDLKLGRSQVLDMLDQVPTPESRPPYSRLLLDPADNLWAERGPTPGEEETSTDFLVFDSAGVLLGIVSLPPIRVLEIGLDYVLGVYTDQVGIQYVHSHELKRQGEGISSRSSG
jgi:hypothetical protein